MWWHWWNNLWGTACSDVSHSITLNPICEINLWNISIMWMSWGLTIQTTSMATKSLLLVIISLNLRVMMKWDSRFKIFFAIYAQTYCWGTYEVLCRGSSKEKDKNNKQSCMWRHRHSLGAGSRLGAGSHLGAGTTQHASPWWLIRRSLTQISLQVKHIYKKQKQQKQVQRSCKAEAAACEPQGQGFTSQFLKVPEQGTEDLPHD